MDGANNRFTDAARILLVDDNAAMLRRLNARLRAAGCAVETATCGEQALAAVPGFHPCVVITDLLTNGMSGMALFDHLHRVNPSLPIIVLTAHGTIPDAVKAAQKGVFSYLSKPCKPRELMDAVARALNFYVGLNGSSPVASVADDTWPDSMITRNPAMRAVLTRARRAAMFDVSVLIQGESGTGKELLARAIHDVSKRSANRFIALNCSAMPEELLESELFGHAKGAFTGATRDHPGLFQAARGGTLFLDEIGDMPLPFQAKLLRAIQEREVRPVGSTHSINIDVRIVAATHRNLREEIGGGRFREDLFYRLNVIPLEIPPLRERRVDIPLLVNHFVDEFVREHADLGQRRFSPKAMEALMAQDWPGNVRQLRNVIKRSMVFSSSPVIDVQLIGGAPPAATQQLPSLADARLDSERCYLVQILEIAHGNVTHAAQLAQRNRTEFYKLLNRHQLHPDRFRSAG